jgi:lipopolysaccharide/colanic/teichoic acid biosynthesis glycosyltransferase
MHKRLFDVCVSLMGLLLVSPGLLLIGLAIKYESRGPVFFRQKRVGQHGKYFRIFKFRTMRTTDLALNLSSTKPPNNPPQLTVAGDSRITPLGTWLRHYKLDELPQLIDVLRGTMSLVGPRPEVPRYVALYPAHMRERILSVRPGMTDWASLRYRHENHLLAQAQDPEREYIEVILPIKLRYALAYVEQTSFTDDLRLIGLTLAALWGRPSGPA